MTQFLKAVLERVSGAFFLLLFCQFPLFIQQYEAHLSGHVKELTRFVSSIQVNAQLSQKSLHEYVAKFTQSKDPDFARQGKLLEGVIVRYERLESGYSSLQQASIWSRPFVFIRYLETDLLQETWKGFQIGLSISLESAIYAVCGLLFGTALAMGILRLFRRKAMPSSIK
ncbi:MAG TPA: DUF2937 family protein [Chlamydiales bacterium]|nr:DUF2937 family protein [Chlamydiales bacterium]